MFTLFPVFCVERTFYGLFLSQSTKKCYYLDRGGPQKAIRSGKASFPPFSTTQKKKIGTKGNGGTFISPSFYLNKKYGNAKKARKVMKVRSQRERVICQVGRKGSCGFFAHFICPLRTTVVDLIN